MKVKEEWKQPISRSDAWKAIIGTLFVVCMIGAFTPILSHLRIERLLSAVLLVIVWVSVVRLISKVKWRYWPTAQKLFLFGFTFLAGADLFPYKAAASWLMNIGGLLSIYAVALTVFDFRKRRHPASTDTAPPAR